MTFRLIFGLGWSLLTGLAGGWLVIAPWALGVQGSGDWTTVTRNQFGAGLGLIVLAVLGLVVVAVQVVGSLRDAGVLVPARPASRRESGSTSSPEMEKALIALAQALAQDLDRQRTDGQASRPAGEHPAMSGWREQG